MPGGPRSTVLPPQPEFGATTSGREARGADPSHHFGKPGDSAAKARLQGRNGTGCPKDIPEAPYGVVVSQRHPARLEASNPHDTEDIGLKGCRVA